VIYGSYTALVYLTALRRWLADRFLGQRRAVLYAASSSCSACLPGGALRESFYAGSPAS
jgi:hypothetical protein